MRWRRRRRDRNTSEPSVLEDMEAAERAGHEELFEVLERLRREVELRNEPSMRSLFAAAEQLAVQCSAQHDRVVEAVTAVRATQDVERALLTRLESIVDLICKLPPLPPSADGGTMGPKEPTTDRDGRGGIGVVSDWPAPHTELPSPFDSERLNVASEAPEVSSRGHPGSGSADRSKAKGQPIGGHDAETWPAEYHGDSAWYERCPARGIAALLFGQFRLCIDGEPLKPQMQGKALKVFSYLVANHARPIHKDALIEMFWPDSAVATGRRGLHQAIYTIRKALRACGEHRQVVVFKDDAYQINPAIESWTDVDDFELHLQRGQMAERDGDLDRARDMYNNAEQRVRGNYLDDALYEDWATAERERLRLAYVDIANRLADLLENAGEISRALDVTSRVLEMEPCDEESHRRAMRCYASTDQRTLAIRQYRMCAEQLKRTYGLAPSPATTKLYNSLT